MSHIVTIRQKAIVNIQKITRKESKYNNKECHQTITGEDKEGRNREKLKNSQKTINKMSISKYLSIIILNVNDLNAPIKRLRVADWIKKAIPILMLPTRDTLQR